MSSSSSQQWSSTSSVCIMCRQPITLLHYPHTHQQHHLLGVSSKPNCSYSHRWQPPVEQCNVANKTMCSKCSFTNQCTTQCLPNYKPRQRHLRSSRTDLNCHLSWLFTCLLIINKLVHRISKMSLDWHMFRILLTVILFASYVTCEGIFELRLDEFVNDPNRDASGRCCSSNMTALVNNRQICEEKCQTSFRVCFKNFQANIDSNPDCVYGEKLTPVMSEGQYSNDIIQFPFNFSWPGTFSLIIEAWHSPSALAPASANKGPTTRSLIARIFESRSDILSVNNTWTEKKANTSNQISLRYSYRVRCEPNYYNQTCTILCKPLDTTYGHYSCGSNGDRICHQGWNGRFCEMPICSRCNSTYGACVAPEQCQCRPGWTGPDCSQCETYPGCVNGYCVKNHECICKEGWGGLQCNLDLNYCTNKKPCKHGGICINTGEGSFTCQCPPGFDGKHCEIKIDICDKSPCQNGATCKSYGDGSNYTCQCPSRYTGRDCERLVNVCDNNPCQNDGTCIDGPSGFLCSCKLGYSGNKCEVRQKDCAPNPCLNGGSCVANSSFASEGGYTCQCRAGFTGDHCEMNINDCESNPCLNEATCIDEVNSFRCRCLPGFTGALCQDNVDDCVSRPCFNGGTCVDSNNDYQCICPQGFAGKDCSINIDDCANNPCYNGGTCKDLINEFECQCTPNFYGNRCQFFNSTIPFAANSFSDTNDFDNSLSSTQLVMIIFGSISLPLLAIIGSIIFVLCKQWRRQDQKRKTRRDDDEARRQNEHNAVMSGLNNKCLNQCLNPSAANVIVNSIEKVPSLHHLSYQNKVTNEYVIGLPFEKSATLGKGFKLVNTAKAVDNEVSYKMDDPYDGHIFEQIQKPSNLLTANLASQHIYEQVHPNRLTNHDIYDSRDIYSNSPIRVKSECAPMITSQETNGKLYSNLHNNIQIAATLQRMGCRSNSIYMIKDHYSQQLYPSDPKKLEATEV